MLIVNISNIFWKIYNASYILKHSCVEFSLIFSNISDFFNGNILFDDLLFPVLSNVN